jgi:hypothetical protein
LYCILFQIEKQLAVYRKKTTIYRNIRMTILKSVWGSRNLSYETSGVYRTTGNYLPK